MLRKYLPALALFCLAGGGLLLADDEVYVRGKDNPAWTQTPVMDFKSASAAELWAGRTVPSRHNTSAPDMVFRDFTASPR